MARIDDGVHRNGGFEINVDGTVVSVAAGETVATALLAAGRVSLRRDGRDGPRGLYCNMGTCCECMVVLVSDDARRLVRACLTDTTPGMIVSTTTQDD